MNRTFMKLTLKNDETSLLHVLDAQEALTNIQSIETVRRSYVKSISDPLRRWIIVRSPEGCTLKVRGTRGQLEYPKLRMALQAAIESLTGPAPTAAQLAQRWNS